MDWNEFADAWSRLNPDEDEAAGDDGAVDDTTNNFFPYDECHPILLFRVFSAVPDLVYLIRNSFSKPCLSDLGKAQNVPPIAC